MVKVSSAIFVAAAVGISASVGCGGGGGATATSASQGPLTKAAFIKRGDAICEEIDKIIDTKAQRYRKKRAKTLNRLSPTAAEEKLVRVIVLPSIAREVDEIEALGIPRADEKKVKAIFDQVGTAIEEAREKPLAVEGEYGWEENPFTPLEEQLREYGFEPCRVLY